MRTWQTTHTLTVESIYMCPPYRRLPAPPPRESLLPYQFLAHLVPSGCPRISRLNYPCAGEQPPTIFVRRPLWTQGDTCFPLRTVLSKSILPSRDLKMCLMALPSAAATTMAAWRTALFGRPARIPQQLARPCAILRRRLPRPIILWISISRHHPLDISIASVALGTLAQCARPCLLLLLRASLNHHSRAR